MKESYGEGLANHTSLESCGNCSNAVAEALTEGSTGGLLSSEITTFGCRPRGQIGKATRAVALCEL
jgi:hypothetical protein